MGLSDPTHPVFQTKRFDVFRATCVRNPALGHSRDVYLAFHRQQDIPSPVCICTIWPKCPIDGLPYVQWIEVTLDDRRLGIASEVLLGVQEFIGPMIAEPVTHAGERLVEALADRLIVAEIPETINTPPISAAQRAPICD